MNLYYTIMTLRGQQKLEEYYHADKTLKLTHMGFGGMNGDHENYIAPNVNTTEIAHEWARIKLERAPKDGFIGGGVTINNDNPDHKGHWICNVGIYDEDGELILISAYRPTLVDPSPAVIAAYVINIQTALSNAANVVVMTDTSLTHPTHDELNAAIASVEGKIPHAATHDEVAQSANDKKFVTPATLNKKGLIQQLQDYATQTANKVKEDIYGGVPAVTLDTIKEVADALLQTGDAVKSIFTKLGALNTAVDSNKNAINNHQTSHAAHTPAQVGAAPAVHGHTPAQVGAAPAVHGHTPEQVGAAPVVHSHTPEQVGAAPKNHGHDWTDIGNKPDFANKIHKHELHVVGDSVGEQRLDKGQLIYRSKPTNAVSAVVRLRLLTTGAPPASFTCNIVDKKYKVIYSMSLVASTLNSSTTVVIPENAHELELSATAEGGTLVSVDNWIIRNP